MISDNPLPSICAKIQTLEILWRNTRKAQSRVGLEPKAGIIAGVAQKDAPSGTKGFYPVKSSFYQPDADPLPLSVRSYGNWP